MQRQPHVFDLPVNAWEAIFDALIGPKALIDLEKFSPSELEKFEILPTQTLPDYYDVISRRRLNLALTCRIVNRLLSGYIDTQGSLRRGQVSPQGQCVQQQVSNQGQLVSVELFTYTSENNGLFRIAIDDSIMHLSSLTRHPNSPWRNVTHLTLWLLISSEFTWPFLNSLPFENHSVRMLKINVTTPGNDMVYIEANTSPFIESFRSLRQCILDIHDTYIFEYKIGDAQIVYEPDSGLGLLDSFRFLSGYLSLYASSCLDDRFRCYCTREVMDYSGLLFTRYGFQNLTTLQVSALHDINTNHDAVADFFRFNATSLATLKLEWLFEDDLRMLAETESQSLVSIYCDEYICSSLFSIGGHCERIRDRFCKLRSIYCDTFDGYRGSEHIQCNVDASIEVAFRRHNQLICCLLIRNLSDSISDSKILSNLRLSKHFNAFDLIFRCSMSSWTVANLISDYNCCVRVFSLGSSQVILYHEADFRDRRFDELPTVLVQRVRYLASFDGISPEQVVEMKLMCQTVTDLDSIDKKRFPNLRRILIELLAPLNAMEGQTTRETILRNELMRLEAEFESSLIVSVTGVNNFYT